MQLHHNYNLFFLLEHGDINFKALSGFWG